MQNGGHNQESTLQTQLFVGYATMTVSFENYHLYRSKKHNLYCIVTAIYINIYAYVYIHINIQICSK